MVTFVLHSNSFLNKQWGEGNSTFSTLHILHSKNAEITNILKCYQVNNISLYIFLFYRHLPSGSLATRSFSLLNMQYIYLCMSFPCLLLFIINLLVHVIFSTVYSLSQGSEFSRVQHLRLTTKALLFSIRVREHWFDSQEPSFLAKKLRIYSTPAFSAGEALQGFQELTFLAKDCILLMCSLFEKRLPIFPA